ncbi:MAG TPA: hypothetical protein VMF12_12525 [Xanthobacteraceae bacterium]|nr:hypothetical protein [Xanthobacteraceae bacterium]
MTVAAICEIATMRPSIASPIPLADTKFDFASRNVTVVAKSTARSSNALSPNAIIEGGFGAIEQNALLHADVTGALSQGRVLAFADDVDDVAWQQPDQTGLQPDHPPQSTTPADTGLEDLRYLKYYIYSEVPPPEKPAVTVLNALSKIPLGTPEEEVQRVADVIGIDPNFMKTVAHIESDFEPKQRTGSYIGLFQLSNAEFKTYGSGEITNSRDNAVAAAFKFLTEAAMFEGATHKKPSPSDLYLIHQQGWQGAAEHVSHPDWLAWKSMCATDEGEVKGERWCKRAIWGNTLPAVKREWKSVDKLTSGAFVTMWRERVNDFYARYAKTGVAQAQQPNTTVAEP